MHRMVKLQESEKPLFNYMATPVSDIQTREVSWWVPESVYMTMKAF